MEEIKLKNGKAHCDQCGQKVSVEEKSGDTSKAEKPYILAGECGHILAGRYTREGTWYLTS
jgi:hypothetical protein